MKKKGIVLAVVTVIILALVVACVVLGQAPNLNMDGTYTAEDGTTLTIAGNTVTCSNEKYSGTMTRLSFSLEYVLNHIMAGSVVEVAELKTAEATYEVVLHQDPGHVLIVNIVDVAVFNMD